MTFNEAWEAEADNWVAWARTPRHDAYWWYAPGFFDGFVPPHARRTLDLGCGEGRTTRDLARRGHTVVSVDASPALIAAAHDLDPDGDYRVADAAALPFPDASFDLVVAYNSLMDVQDMPRAVREASRVLGPDGSLCACVTHPLMDAGRWESHGADSPFLLTAPYFETRPVDGTPLTRDGLTISFHGWCYPLEAYARALEAAGLVIAAIREPSVHAEDPRHARVPPYLWFRALRAGLRA